MPVELTGGDVSLESEGSFDRLGVALDELIDDGHVDDEDGVAASGGRRVRISRTFLWLLGYLKKDNGKPGTGATYRSAVGRFLADAGLPPSETLDDVAWEALRELAQFDTVTDVDRWLADPAARPALERAARLRLFSYGLTTTKPTHKVLTGGKLRKHRNDLQKAIDDFARIASRLRLADVHLDPGLNAPLLALLFGHNSLSRKIQWSGDGYRVFSGHPDLPVTEKTASKLTKGFVGNLALVELWLLGYEVRPGTFKAGSAHSRDRDGTLHAALDKFATDRKLTGVNTDQIKVAKWFFDEAHAIGDSDPNEATVSEQELNGILQSKKKREALKESYSSLGARIIDGIKRAVTWVVGLFRKVGRVVKQLIRNVARVIYRGVAPVIRHLMAMFEVVAIGFRYFFTSPIEGSRLDEVYVRKRADFDLDVYIDERAAPGTVDAFFEIFDLRVRALRLGGRIIGKLWDLIDMAIRMSSAVVGWLSLILTLMKFGNWFRRTVDLARESYALIQEFDAFAPRSA